MNGIYHFLIATSLSCILLAAPTTAPTTMPSTVVKIENFSFIPKQLTIKVGTTVTWRNDDDVPHTATGDGETPAFDSGPLDTDDKFSFTFNHAGTFNYYCKVHPHMTGTIVVN